MIFMSIKTAPVGSFGFCLGLQTLDLGRLATLAVDWQKHRLLAAGEDTPDPNSADVEHRIWGILLDHVGSLKRQDAPRYDECPTFTHFHVRSTEG